MASPEQLQEVVSDFMTMRETAQAIGKNVRTLKYWKASGYGPDHFYIGKRVFYRRGDVISWLEKISATQPPVTAGRKVRA